MKKTVKIVNNSGLHARPANLLAKEASKYKCDVEIEFRSNVINAKSIIGIMSLGASKGSEIEIITNGEDEKEAMEALVNLVESGFGE